MTDELSYMSLYSLSTEANKVETLNTLRAVLANSTSHVYLDYWCLICMSQPCRKSISHYVIYDFQGANSVRGYKIPTNQCKKKHVIMVL